jgi:hypothetical protein
VYETLHPATPIETAAIVQLVAEKVPGESETKLTLPVGVTTLPPLESVIVTVQLEAWFTTTGLVQTIAVEVVRGLMITLAALLMLASWAASPLYAPVTVAVPVVIAVKVTEQLPETRVQVAELKDPAAPVSVKLTLPDGMITVPGEVSDTVAVHDEAWLTTTGLEQTKEVEVVRGFTAILAAALVLPPCDESPPYVPVASPFPVAVGVNVTEQLPDDRVQVVELNEPAGPVSANVTVPVGVIGLIVEVSLTVAVQVDAWFTITVEGEQLTTVADVCWPTWTWTKSKCSSEPLVALIVTL